jgi:hypothetical protein
VRRKDVQKKASSASSSRKSATKEPIKAQADLIDFLS